MNIHTHLETNGNVWEKGNYKRIYVANKQEFIKFLGETLDEFQTKRMKEAKIWLDMEDNSIHSDIGTVRVILNRAGIKCTK